MGSAGREIDNARFDNRKFCRPFSFHRPKFLEESPTNATYITLLKKIAENAGDAKCKKSVLCLFYG